MDEVFTVYYGDLTPADEKSLQEFKDLYNSAFPNVNERENYDVEILPRLRQGQEAQSCVKTIAVLMKKNDGAGIAGGMIADWYPVAEGAGDPGFLEIIYIAVDDKLRWSKNASEGKRPNYGRRLLTEGTDEICRTLGVARQSIHVFFEAENPFHPDNKGCLDQTIERLRFFSSSKIGARLIPISYVQPPLSVNSGFARNLFLFELPAVPVDSSVDTSIDPAVLKRFLKLFYEGLLPQNRQECNDSNKDELDKIKDLFEVEMKRMEGEIDRILVKIRDKEVYGEMTYKDAVPTLPIDEAVLKEDDGSGAAVAFSNIVFAAHYAVASDVESAVFDKAESSPCTTYNSYEKDLFNYNSQKEPPFHTYFAGKKDDASLTFPAFYSFVSEGIRHYCLSKRTEVEVKVSVSWSERLVRGEKYRVVHLMIAPGEDVAFSPQEAVKIVAGLGYGSNQESVETLENTGPFLHSQAVAFIESLTGLKCEMLTSLGTGICEINTKASVFATHSAMRNALCGILSGIFDFNRMTPAEAKVMLKKVYDGEEIDYYSNRGNLMRQKDRTPDQDERLDNVLISPYLTIPSAALCFNEMLLNKQMEMLNGKKRIRNRLLNVPIIKHTLSTYMFRDIFQYESEQKIMSDLMESRSLNMLENRLLAECKISYSKQNYFWSGLQAVLLALIAVLQVLDVFKCMMWAFWLLIGLLAALGLFGLVQRLRE